MSSLLELVERPLRQILSADWEEVLAVRLSYVAQTPLCVRNEQLIKELNQLCGKNLSPGSFRAADEWLNEIRSSPEFAAYRKLSIACEVTANYLEGPMGWDAESANLPDWQLAWWTPVRFSQKHGVEFYSRKLDGQEPSGRSIWDGGWRHLPFYVVEPSFHGLSRKHQEGCVKALAVTRLFSLAESLSRYAPASVLAGSA
ncbi:MAG TPA: hypothetical protein VLA04_00860 [Verrucomicrobiae bacterium]|nr:hypothetical protein [Verrucomicrobiae bacterium]